MPISNAKYKMTLQLLDWLFGFHNIPSQISHMLKSLCLGNTIQYYMYFSCTLIFYNPHKLHLWLVRRALIYSYIRMWLPFHPGNSCSTDLMPLPEIASKSFFNLYQYFHRVFLHWSRYTQKEPLRNSWTFSLVQPATLGYVCPV